MTNFGPNPAKSGLSGAGQRNASYLGEPLHHRNISALFCLPRPPACARQALRTAGGPSSSATRCCRRRRAASAPCRRRRSGCSSRGRWALGASGAGAHTSASVSMREPQTHVASRAWGSGGKMRRLENRRFHRLAPVRCHCVPPRSHMITLHRLLLYSVTPPCFDAKSGRRNSGLPESYCGAQCRIRIVHTQLHSTQSTAFIQQSTAFVQQSTACAQQITVFIQ